MLLSTRFYVDKPFMRNDLYGLCLDWLSTSSYYDFNVDSMKDIDLNNADDTVFISENERAKITVNGYETRFVLQIANEDEDVKTVTTFVLDDSSDIPSLYVSQDKTTQVMQVDAKPLYPHLPTLLKNVFWNEFGGEDGNLMTQMTAHQIGKRDTEWVFELLTGKREYLLPVLFQF